MRARTSGFTLVEVIIALALAGAIGAFVVRFFGAQQRAYGRQSHAMLATQNVRAGVDLLLEELRNAGFDPRGTAGARLTVADGDSIGWTADLNADGDAADSGAWGDEAVLYYRDRAARTLMRRAGGIAVPVAEWIDTLSFRYFDESGTATVDPDRAVRVELFLRFTAPSDAISAGLLTGTTLPNRLP
ncbi:MAG: PilW family protein [Gemmatimonadota bacterium]